MRPSDLDRQKITPDFTENYTKKRHAYEVCYKKCAALTYYITF